MSNVTPARISPLESLEALSTTGARHYIESWRSVGARRSLHLLLEDLRRSWCIVRLSFRSFRGHISTQFSKDQGTPHLGKSWGRNHLGQIRRNPRTVARRLYTEKLLATLPWADSQDLQIFLMGFEAGEQWNACSGGSQDNMQTDEASWLTILDKTSQSVPDTIRQMTGGSDAR
jgi:hypothetical protein